MSCLARGASHMAAPILRPLQLRCLSALSFLDRQLAVVQDVAAVLFPRSEGAFRKVDELVLLLESQPVRFDCAIDGLEVLVACVKGGVVTGLAPKRCCCRVDEAGDDVFRDIRCDDEEENALHRATADDEVVMAMKKRCEDATREVESVEVVVTVDGSDDDDDDSGAGDPAETIGTVGPAETITQEETEHDEKAEGDVVQAACEEAMHPETDQPEVSYVVAERTSEAESKGEEDLVKRNVSSGGEECVQELEREDRSMEVAEGAETHTAEIIEAMQSSEIRSVEGQEVSSQEGAASEKMGEAIAVSGSSKDSKEDALLDLFDEAWQQKLA